MDDRSAVAGSPALDEAFLPLHELVPLLLPDLPDLVDEEAGVRSRVTAVELETPVELDVVLDDAGRAVLGGAPPLYHLETSWLPVLHQLRLTAERGSP